MIYGVIKKQRFLLLLLGILVGFFVYGGFILLQTKVLNMTLLNPNTSLIIGGMENLFSFFVKLDFGDIYVLLNNFLGKYITQMNFAFFTLPVLYAFIGLNLSSRQTNLTYIGIILLLPSAMGFAFLYFGQVEYIVYPLVEFPRLSFAAYPAIFVLASKFLYDLRHIFKARHLEHLGNLVVALLIIIVVILNNIDAFGFIPQAYFYFTNTSHVFTY